MQCIYKAYFDGGNLLSPIIHPEMNVTIISVLGTIISRAYLVSGTLPIRIAFPTLAHCLLGPGVNVSSSVLVQTFLDSLSPHDANIIKRANEEVLLQQPKDLMPSLLSILSHFRIRALPGPPNF